MTAVPQRAAAMATAGVPPQTALTMTRNMDSVPVEVSDRKHNAQMHWSAATMARFLTVVVTLFGQIPL